MANTSISSEELGRQIERNAAEIIRLHLRVHETFRDRGQDPDHHRAWQDAASAFHARYDALAFPGGWSGALGRLVEGDPTTMESAVLFLEQRPFFFRSGYMWRDILRKARQAPLSDPQKARLAAVIERWEAYKALRRTQRESP
jgi:hypothetical protein